MIARVISSSIASQVAEYKLSSLHDDDDADPAWCDVDDDALGDSDGDGDFAGVPAGGGAGAADDQIELAEDIPELGADIGRAAPHTWTKRRDLYYTIIHLLRHHRLRIFAICDVGAIAE